MSANKIVCAGCARMMNCSLRGKDVTYCSFRYPKVTNQKSSATDNTASKYDIHHKVCEVLNDIYRRKNADYGDSFSKGYAEYGMIMPVIRLEDKLSRFKKLALGSDQMVKDESVKDTLIDLANYAIMTLVEMEVSK